MTWLRANAFLLGLLAATALAFGFPAPGARGGWLQPELLTNAGVALILLLQGWSLPFEKVREGAANWRLHVVVQAFTFAVFPLAGLALNALLPALWPAIPPAIRDGFLYLCVLPSTVSSSVVFTSVARGNTAGALFNAAFSNVLGVLLTPVLVQLLMRTTGQTTPVGPLLLKITGLTLAPFALGAWMRTRAAAWIDARKPWVTRLSNGAILFMVYAAFCDSVQDRVWQRHGAAVTVQTLAFALGLFGFMSVLIAASCRALRLDRADFIAGYFCAVKKTLAMGVPLAVLIFGTRADLSLILLPIMFYHPIQLLVNGVLANRWGRAAA
ncbi:bile acid:sodium symporter family protein [Oleiharenicola sp. Vm1]|uniref:bile acid:sodium symporter family protein n=1 Tax=Oleiharenicola sp. Vm1 TaxID=3398393 RepID=UPI0039F47CA5